MELDSVDMQILNSLTFPEPFEILLEEVKTPEKIIGDSLKVLMDKGLVQALSENELTQKWERGFFYNSDNMHDYRYQITTKGLDLLF